MFKILFLALLSLFFCSNAEAKRFQPPVLTAEFDQMAFPPLYPTFSWEPLPDSRFYQVQVVNVDKNIVVRDLLNSEALNRVTDWNPFNEKGNFYWHVRLVDKNSKPLSDWSEKQYFSVDMPVKFAAFGDSITHGGAAYIPAGQLSCQWQTYCDFPIKNLARSGDTTEMMINRFDNDVLPFRPQYLIIMAGVNDIRVGKSADSVIKNFEILRDKCLSNNITPIFCTITPMNPEKITKRGIFLTDNDWRHERELINIWIMKKVTSFEVTFVLFL